ncbi:hypothetical protein [Duganella sp. HH105]|uniref:hypothetical protein n=1 Tax=Duganella sp. HH105 TaxID=1781067 RepID=UPI00090007FD|nr:hypothetical protein [Duganella sp. HH105]
MNAYEKQNRERLINLLQKVPRKECPAGWEIAGRFAVGGLTEIGFSRSAEILLVISSSGRGVIDCALGAKVSRDDESSGDWYMPAELVCRGIEPLESEIVQIAGLHGGGLLTATRRGESLEVASPDWPKSDLFFCPNNKSAVSEGHQQGCTLIASDYFRAYGFSWSGNSFAFATSSDVTVFRRRSE